MDKKNIDEMPKKSPLSLQIDLQKFEKATDEEKKQQDVMSESVSFFRDGMRKLMKNPACCGKYCCTHIDCCHDSDRAPCGSLFLFPDHFCEWQA